MAYDVKLGNHVVLTLINEEDARLVRNVLSEVEILDGEGLALTVVERKTRGSTPDQPPVMDFVVDFEDEDDDDFDDEEEDHT